MAIEAKQPYVDNFQILASYAALEVLLQDDYFLDLPKNWQQIIHKIKEKLSTKEQQARFEEKLNDMAQGQIQGQAKSVLPDAIKHLISALNNSALPQPSTLSKSALDKLSRAYTPMGLSGKISLKAQPYFEEELAEERCPQRTLFPPVN